MADAYEFRQGTAWAVGRLGPVVAIRLAPGEDVLKATSAIAARAGLEQGIILGGVASLTHATVRNIVRLPDPLPITENDRVVTVLPGPLEVVALSGNFSRAPHDTLFMHCHVEMSLGDPPATTVGGHLVEGTQVATTAEIFLAELTGPALDRRLDPRTMALEMAVQRGRGDER